METTAAGHTAGQLGRDRLAQWIERSRLNQREAAAVIGIDHTQLNQILKGQRRPGLDNAVKIERATGITVDAWVPLSSDETSDRVVDAPRKWSVGNA